MNIHIVPPESAPLALLLTADPSADRIAQYIRSGTVFVGEDGGVAVAVAVLERSGSEAELRNTAVAGDWQGGGWGRRILSHVLSYAAAAGVGRVLVGTGNSSFRPLRFYQKNGFRVVGVVPGFFDDYTPPIFEDGIACRDMIRLAIDLNEAAPN